MELCYSKNQDIVFVEIYALDKIVWIFYSHDYFNHNFSVRQIKLIICQYHLLAILIDLAKVKVTEEQFYDIIFVRWSSEYI